MALAADIPVSALVHRLENAPGSSVFLAGPGGEPVAADEGGDFGALVPGAPAVPPSGGVFAGRDAEGRRVAVAYAEAPCSGWSVILVAPPGAFPPAEAWPGDGAWAGAGAFAGLVGLAAAARVPRRRRSGGGDATEAALDRALADRRVLIGEVCHRVRNNLQTVDGLLGMSAASASGPEAARMLSGLRDHVHVMGLAHRRLMSSGDLSTFDIAAFMADVSGHMAAEAGVSVVLSCDPVRAGLDFAVPLGLIVAELVAAAAGGGTVRVGLALSSPGTVDLVVSRCPALPGETWPPPLRRLVRGLVGQLGGTLGADAGEREIRVTVKLPEAA